MIFSVEINESLEFHLIFLEFDLFGFVVTLTLSLNNRRHKITVAIILIPLTTKTATKNK